MYGHLNEDGELVAARNPAMIDGALTWNALREDYARIGELPVVDEPPECEAGYHAEAVGWREEDGEIRRIYDVVQDVRPVRNFSRLKLFVALSARGKWDGLETWMKSQTVGGINVYTAYILANELADDHPLFAAYLAQAQAELGISDAERDAILAEAEA